MIVENFPDRTIKVDGKAYLYFGGTAYLGLPTHPEFQKLLKQGIEKWGSFYGSSRSSNIQLSIFSKVEALFAEKFGTEDAVTTSSGTLAGKLIMEYLAKKCDTFYHYPKTHPAILHPSSLPLFQNGTLHPDLTNNKDEHIVITADAILALNVEPTTFSFLKDISPNKKITLVFDESHSLGLFGKHGEGIFKTIDSPNLTQKIAVASLGKALGLSGGIIASDKKCIEDIKKEILFISSSCASPAYLETYSSAQKLIQIQREKLQNNLDILFQDLKLSPIFKNHPHYPVMYCEDESLYNYLLKNDVVVSSFNYPNYKGKMCRIVITANHIPEDLNILKRLLNAFPE